MKKLERNVAVPLKRYIFVSKFVKTKRVRDRNEKLEKIHPLIGSTNMGHKNALFQCYSFLLL